MSEDARTTRTKKKIKESFLKLLQQRSYEQISVSDIAKDANINRVTFYTHYIDKACLLADLMEDMKKKFLLASYEHAQKIDTENEIVRYSVGMATALLDVFDANKELIRLLAEKENAVIRRILEDHISNFVTVLLNKLDQITPLKYPVRYVSAFITPAFISLALKFVTDPNPIPKEEFKKQLTELSENIVKNKLFTK